MIKTRYLGETAPVLTMGTPIGTTAHKYRGSEAPAVSPTHTRGSFFITYTHTRFTFAATHIPKVRFVCISETICTQNLISSTHHTRCGDGNVSNRDQVPTISSPFCLRLLELDGKGTPNGPKSRDDGGISNI